MISYAARYLEYRIYVEPKVRPKLTLVFRPKPNVENTGSANLLDSSVLLFRENHRAVAMPSITLAFE